MHKIVSFLIASILIINLSANDFILKDNSINKSEKTALVILNGFGDSNKNRKIQLDYFKNKGMDIYIPKYKVRNSLAKTVNKFTEFYNKNEISEYKEVYFLCYIIGGYVLNEFIQSNGNKNIKKIIYDRSPTQERAARIGVDKLPFISRFLYGKILFDFSKVKLRALSKDNNLLIGVIVENQATSLMRYFEKSSYKYGKYSFNINDINSNNDDFFHTWLDHNLMYKRFDVIGNEILYFYKNGVFTDQAKREKYNWDPFKKIRL